MSEKNVSIRGRELTGASQGGSATVGNSTATLVEITEPGEALIDLDGRRLLVPFAVSGETVEFILNGERVEALVTAPGAKRRGGGREHSMAAPMPGVILKILVEPNDAVTKGTPLLVLEAMKMEHQIRAPRDGTVAAIRCSVGELVQPGVDLIELQGEES